MEFDNDPIEAIEIALKKSFDSADSNNSSNNNFYNNAKTIEYFDELGLKPVTNDSAFMVPIDGSDSNNNNNKKNNKKKKKDKNIHLTLDDEEVIIFATDSRFASPVSNTNNNVKNNNNNNTISSLNKQRIDFLQDKRGHQTFGRRLATFLSQRYTWYNPQLKLLTETNNNNNDNINDSRNETKKANIGASGLELQEKKKDNDNNNNNEDDDSMEHPTDEAGTDVGDEPIDDPDSIDDGNGDNEHEENHPQGDGNKQQQSQQQPQQQQPQQQQQQDEEKQKEPPSLAKAWAFFEHVTLNRYVIPNNYRRMSIWNSDAEKEGKPFLYKFLYKCFRGERKLEIAEPGEDTIPTKLYSPFHTPLSQLGDFGLGYGLYFSTVRAFAVLSLLAGLINIPSIRYFRSDEYSQGQTDLSSSFLRGSAICTDRTWVPCPTCQLGDFDSVGSYEVVRDIYGDGFVPGKDGDNEFLNVTKYIGIDIITFEFLFSEKSLDLLYDDYQIRFDNSTLSVQCEGYGTYDCETDCFWETLFCDAANGDCILDLRFLPTIPPYSDLAYEEFGFALKTNCEGATIELGFANFMSILLFIAGTSVIRYRQRAIATNFDEDEQTAQDYSIQISNPPPDSHDANEWKAFFENNFNCHVTICTVDVANDNILKLLIERRDLLRQLEFALPKGTKLDMDTLEEESKKASQEKKGFIARMFAPNIPNLINRLKEVTEESTRFLEKEKNIPVTNVFVTFETEKAQREVLSSLSVGSVSAGSNDTSAVSNPKFLFRGLFVLDVHEPEEPSSVRWQELNASGLDIVVRLVVTSFITCISLLFGFIVIMGFYAARLPLVASIVTTVMTMIFPEIAKALTSMEYHKSETSRQKWMFIKITIFNIAMTSILLSLVTPFVATLDKKEGSVPGLIPSVYGLFFSQLVISPCFQLLDIGGHIQRHLLAPRATTQEAMDMKMRGSAVYLAERYANLVKFLFLMVWYCAIFPAVFFLGSLALFVVYFVDRFSLMRTWARTPQIGTKISDFARNYFSPAAIVFMAVTSAYAWSGFPYDNLCVDEDTELYPAYVREWSVNLETPPVTFLGRPIYDAPDINENFTIAADAQVYKFCKQDLRFTKGKSFPPLAKFQPEGLEWMTEDQAYVVQIFGWSAVAILAGVILVFLYRIGRAVHTSIHGSYVPVGDDQGQDYSKVRSIDSYVPQKQSPYFLHPLLLCDLKNIDPALFSWSDPDRPHSFYSIVNDIKEFMDPKDVKVSHIFSEVKHWPPGYDGVLSYGSHDENSEGWQSMEMNVFSGSSGGGGGGGKGKKNQSSEPEHARESLYSASKIPDGSSIGNGNDRGNNNNNNDSNNDNNSNSSEGLEAQMKKINEHLNTLSGRVEQYQAEGMTEALANIQRDLKRLLESEIS